MPAAIQNGGHERASVNVSPESAARTASTTVTGGRTAMRKGSPVVRPVTMRVRIGEPVETAGLTVDDRDALILEVRGRVQALLAEEYEHAGPGPRP